MEVDGHEWRWMDADERRWDVNGRGWSGWVWMGTNGDAGDYQIKCKGKKYLLDAWGATSMWLSDNARGGGGGGRGRGRHRAVVATVDRGCANGRIACRCIKCDADG